MKLLRLLFLFLASGFILTACQKDYSAETGTAKGAIVKDITGDCLPATINGTYKKDTALTANNYVDLQVFFDKVGLYNIKTDTINGYYFVANGIADITGVNTIRLRAYGKPKLIQTDLFTVKFDTSTCAFNIEVGGVASTTTAFTFANTAGACTNTIAGTYVTGTAMTAANTVTVPVTVTVPGGYDITTTANGVTFRAVGSVTAATTSIVFIATGTAINPGAVVYPISSGTSNCDFTITYTGTAVIPAVFTINCATSAATGTFQAGTALTANDKITLQVNVTTAGSYNVTTGATLNNLTFTGNGVFATTGANTIVLTANGQTPNNTTASTVPYTATGNGVSCAVNVPLTVGGGGGTANFIKAKINGSTTFTNFTLNLSAILTNSSPSSLEISGDAASGETFLLGLDRPTPIVTNVLYNINDFATGTFITVDYEDPTLVLYNTTPINIVTADPFKLTITSITATRIEGTFSGSLEEDAPTGATPLIKKFTEGSFSLPL
jgi:hypothetical protein